ncbi:MULTISPECIES: hypothetical protein [Corynebacterium]|uniref:hypothetical protein n=1 Tax=Corynebacterium TaxID=1716 RepID=UPI000944B2AE|nr:MULTISPECIES: hypothetical protein [Corynebacterium]AST22092.1 hypothetical protein CEY17_15965 [Corynebacterium glutamicum ATCC 14067]QJS17239.1 hypothetical protein HK412_13940 [Corynebacterium glutamicum]QXU45760.1 hypothetical protein KW808_15820 [[Brevibacterium] flavum]
MPENSTPVFKMYTTAELRAERQELPERMRPFNLEQMHRLYNAGLLSAEESEILDIALSKQKLHPASQIR